MVCYHPICCSEGHFPIILCIPHILTFTSDCMARSYVVISCENCKRLQGEVDRLTQEIQELRQQLLVKKDSSEAISASSTGMGIFSKQQVGNNLVTGLRFVLYVLFSDLCACKVVPGWKISIHCVACIALSVSWHPVRGGGGGWEGGC